MHRLLATLSVAAILAGPLAQPASAAVDRHGSVVRVDGTVSTPATYTLDALGALPQTTVTVSTPTRHGPRSHTDQGVELETIVNLASPILPNAKNAFLRVVITVSGDDISRTFALGELDPNFGDHAALVVLRQDGRALNDGPELVVPADKTGFRSIERVRRITVGVESPPPTTPATSGGVDVITARRHVELSATELAHLQSLTLDVTFIAGTASQHHTETGPTLAAVLAAAHVHTGPDTWVAAVGSDGYIATVTPAEAIVGGRPLLISTAEDGAGLPQPRLATDGDIKGGRYVSGVVDLVVGHGALPHVTTGDH